MSEDSTSVLGYASSKDGFFEDISPPGVDDKDACIFSEKVEDKYIIFRRIRSSITRDIVDNLNFDGTNWTGMISVWSD